MWFVYREQCLPKNTDIFNRVLEFLLFVTQLFLGLKTNFIFEVICNFGSAGVNKSWILVW